MKKYHKKNNSHYMDMMCMNDEEEMMDDCFMSEMEDEMHDYMHDHMHGNMNGNMHENMHENMHGKMQGSMPEHTILAHAYVPWQCYNKAFCPEEALMKGTLFPELYGVYEIPE